MLIFGIIVGTFVFVAKAKEDAYIRSIISETGSCFLNDGTCLHADTDITIYVIGWGISLGVLLFGIYLMVFDKTQEVLFDHQKKVSSALRDVKKSEKFKSFLQGFNDNEQIVLKAVHDQEGILQATLRYRTGMSKTSLSVLLKSLENRGIINRIASGKTNKVFLKKNGY